MEITALLNYTSGLDATASRPSEQEAAHIEDTELWVRDDELMDLWRATLANCDVESISVSSRNTLTDCILKPVGAYQHHNRYLTETSSHMKIIGRHMNGSFRCHIGMGKASRPITSEELQREMRLLVVFFRPVKAMKIAQYVSPHFICFPTWLLHLFRYSQHESTPGRTDIRFLENEALAKEDHIYRINHVINSLFRFNLRTLSRDQLFGTIELANFLFDTAQLKYINLPPPALLSQKAILYESLLALLHTQRPSKSKPICSNCHAKPASRRKLCVACYRYVLKHGDPRPLRLIITSRHQQQQQQQQPHSSHSTRFDKQDMQPEQQKQRQRKQCANCGVQQTHQWYRNLCGDGHWCETCKSYYLRHMRVRPRELFLKAAKRKVDVQALVDWSLTAYPRPVQQQQDDGCYFSSTASTSTVVDDINASSPRSESSFSPRTPPATGSSTRLKKLLSFTNQPEIAPSPSLYYRSFHDYF